MSTQIESLKFILFKTFLAIKESLTRCKFLIPTPSQHCFNNIVLIYQRNTTTLATINLWKFSSYSRDFVKSTLMNRIGSEVVNKNNQQKAINHNCLTNLGKMGLAPPPYDFVYLVNQRLKMCDSKPLVWK